MDFFNYAGLQRPVLVYTTPQTAYLEDISITTRLDARDAHLNVFVAAAGSATVLITLRDAQSNVVTRGRMPTDPRRGGRLTVSDPMLWWPRYMSDTPGYLYTIVVEVRAGVPPRQQRRQLRNGARAVDGGMAHLNTACGQTGRYMRRTELKRG